jgi:hypothetical protein
LAAGAQLSARARLPARALPATGDWLSARTKTGRILAHWRRV